MLAMKIVVVKRLLRHKKPIIIVPYYVGTREAELITKITENYKKEKIITINNIDEINL